MLDQLAEIFSVLGNKQRLKILALVSKKHGITEKELVKQLNLSQGTISYHLNKLYLTDLLYKEKNKTSFEIEINFEKLKSIGLKVPHLIKILEQQME